MKLTYVKLMTNYQYYKYQINSAKNYQKFKKLNKFSSTVFIK